MQQRKQPQLGHPAEQGSHEAGQQPQHCELQGKQPEGFTPGQAQAAQQGAGIKTAIGEAGCRQCHCDT